MTLRILRSLLLFALVALPAHAQLVSSLRLTKSQYIAGEPVIAIVTITNHSGGELILQSVDRIQWLDFMVKNLNGQPVTSPPVKNFGPIKIGAGQSMAREVDLTQYFHLYEPGNFSVAAIVRMPGGDSGTSTNRLTFNVNPGRPYWTQKVGVPGKPGVTREYRILNFNGDQKSQLYAQVIDGRTGMPIRTFLLGESLSLRKPSVTIDRNQRMHVMFLATPAMFVHCQVDLDGRLADRKIHQRASQGDPQLVTSSTGEVGVINSVIYDPEAIRAAKAKQRKASDRPAFIYE